MITKEEKFMVDHTNLVTAKREKSSEFYTRWEDIEAEVNAYLEYNADVFKDKVVLCPADDPFESNFFKFFATHFNDFGLKKLISTSYDPSPIVNTQIQLSLFDDENNDKKSITRTSRAYKIELSDVSDFDHNGRVNINDVEDILISERRKIRNGKRSKILSFLDVDPDNGYSAGDFRSSQVTQLRDESDMIITNPPFYLFRSFIKWANPAKRNVLLLGNLNAISYKEVFPLIEANNLWLGATNFNKGMYFYVPDDFEYKKSYHFEREMNGNKVSRVPGVCWFTNIDHGRRHEPLRLMTEKDNIKYSKHKNVRNHKYRKYDNYDAIEVPFTDAIPNDYDGLMGVPVTFLDKYNPSQFEIKGITQSWYGAASKIYPKQIQVNASGQEKEVTKLNDGPAIKIDEPLDKTYYKVSHNLYEKIYSRILIKKK